MKKYCFFGHRDCPESMYEVIRGVILGILSREEGVEFLVGNQGQFDFLVRKALKELSEERTFKYSLVLAYINRKEYDPLGDIDTCSIYPEGLENAPLRFAIDRRNRWMIDNSDCIIGYVTSRFGNAHKYLTLAEKKGKEIINLGELLSTKMFSTE